MKNLKKSTYYQKLIAILLFFTLLFIIPYALFLYNSSKKQLMKSIQHSNEQSLMQIKYSYDTFNDMMRTLCYSVYRNNETKSMLYNQNIPSSESTEQIRYLKSSVLNIYPSVYSISLYNGGQQRFYSTLTDSTRYFAELHAFLENTPEIPKLKPILRKVPYMYTDNYIYVFSYILYDFTDDTGMPYSYVVLDQNASWLIDNFNKIGDSDNHIPSRIYLLDQNGTVCSEDLNQIPDIDNKIFKQYFQEQGKERSLEPSYYTYNLEGMKYLVTSLILNDNGDSLVLLQDYQEVFSDLESFRFTFQIILIIWTLLLLLVILGISKNLYAPIQSTLTYVGELSGQSIEEGNEFLQLKNIYKDSYDKAKKQNRVTSGALKQYQLEKLLTDSSPSALRDFTAFSPEHWLSKHVDGHLQVLLLTINRGAGARNTLSEEDYSLFLFTIQNILSELLNEECRAEVFITRNAYVWGILQINNAGYDLILEDVLSRTRDTLQKYISLPLDATYSRPVEHPSQLNLLYHEVLSLHNYHYIYGPDAIIDPLACKKNLINDSKHIPKNLEKKCLSALKCDHVSDAIDNLHLIFDSFKEMQYEHVQICMMTLTNQINFVLKEMCVSRGVASAIQFEQIYHQLDHAQYLEEMEAALKKYLSDSMNVFLAKKEDTKQQLFVDKIKEYIDLNYSDSNLSSQMLGDYLNLSAKYVMKKFQDSTGVSLNDYITEIRMRQAAAILKNSDLPISKVAEQVGILNENYFYKLFKKMYGCTPREFSAYNFENNTVKTNDDGDMIS